MSVRHYKVINHHQGSEISVSTYYTSYNALLAIVAGDSSIEVCYPLEHINAMITALIDAKAALEHHGNYSPALRK